MSRLLLFYRLIVRPLLREPVRTLLTLLAIALGVAVVLAIDLAGSAAAGSFHSSMETLAGANDLEIVTAGGVPENLVGTLSAMPYPLRITPRIEDYAVIAETKKTVPLVGLDLVAEASHSKSPVDFDGGGDTWKYLTTKNSIWVGESLGRKSGETLALLINDQVAEYTVRGLFPDSQGNTSAIVMDISAAQIALKRFGRVDRILIQVPQSPILDEWKQRIAKTLPEGIQVRAAGAGTDENRRMLAAFRWNLRLLSYIALIVGAFLIYNTISVSVVRRRAEIGIVRALGASRTLVLAAFVGEAACFGFLGALIGLPLGRLMAGGAVRLMGETVEALYVSSRPGVIALTPISILLALLVGVGVAVASAFSPAREAALVPPVEAMAHGRREYVTTVNKTRDAWIGLAVGLAAAAATRAPAIGGKPLFGYFASLLLIGASAFAMPALVDGIARMSSRLMKTVLGVEAVLASRSLSSSLRRTSVLVGALSTAIAMMTAVGIMVGSFRETVLLWMDDQLPADLYLRSAAGTPAGRKYKSAGNWSSIQSKTVSRKLPTIMPTAVIMAIAVDSAPTKTEVRRNEDERLRDARTASTPNIFFINREDIFAIPSTHAGMAKADAPMSKSDAK